jgi:small subunit ribosomal protein S7e
MKKQQSELLEQITKQVQLLAKSSSDNEKLFKNCRVVDAKEYKFQTEDNKTTKALVIYVPEPYHKDNQSTLKKLINHLTEKRSQHTFVVAKRTIVHKRSDYKQRIPHNRTLTSVYDSILDDLLNPGVIIGKRLRIRLNGSQLVKVHVNEDSQKYLPAERVSLIENLYFALTNRKIAVEFRAETSYVQVPRVRKVKKTKQPRRANKKPVNRDN